MRSMERDGDMEPVSPRSQYLNSSILSVTILVVFEFEIPFDDSQVMVLLETEFLPINQRFSSIMVQDEDGVQQWKKVDVNLEEHVIIPVFPHGLSLESNEKYLQEYLSKIAMVPLPQNRPMWEIHIIKYPTTGAAGTVVYKINHAVGDGYSLMAALFSSVKRADDPSLPLTLPSSKSNYLQSAREMNTWKRVCSSLPVLWYTLTDFIFSLLKSNLLEDDRTPIRSATDGVEFRPMTISSIIFSLDLIQQIKNKLGATVNDVICGIIFYGIQLYMQQKGTKKALGDTHVTAQVLLNTRIISGCNYKSLEEMAKKGTESPWGNHFSFFLLPLPCCGDIEKTNPLEFALKAKQMIDRKKSSLAVYLNAAVLEILRMFKGPQAAAKQLHDTLRKTSITISNMVGPIQKMVMADHPVKSFYCMTIGLPQSLTITVVSYNGSVRVTVGAEKGFIDSRLLISCLKTAFTRMVEAAIKGKDTIQLYQ